MISLVDLYILFTFIIFTYTAYDHYLLADNYFKAIITYFADDNFVFIFFNAIIASAVLLYKIVVMCFFSTVLEGEVIVLSV